MVDLHVHSNRSDGTLSPKELVDYAIEKGLDAFALTDHDTTEGLEEAIEYADSLRASGINPPEVIPGIEFSTDLNGEDVHIVALFIDYKNEAFNSYLTKFVESRELRNKKMCEMFKEAGMDIDYEELVKANPGAVLTRAHYATMLVEKGYVSSKKEAFDRYIGDHKPFHIPREKIKPEDAVEITKLGGGIAILAHPILYGFSKAKLERLVSSLKDNGLIGIEAVYSTYAPSDERYIREVANKYHLLLSGGSDFHGTNKDGIDLGVGKGNLYVDNSILYNLKMCRKNILFTDLDGTLLLDDATISESMRNEIKRVTDLGHKVVFASGRPFDSVLEVKVKSGLNYRNTWIISNNGAYIYDCDNETAIRSCKLSQELVRKVVQIVDEAGEHVHCYTNKEIVGYSEDEEVKFYRRRIHMPFIATNDIAAFLPEGSFKVQIINLTDHERLERLKERLLKELGDEIELFFSNRMYLEVMPKGVNKGSAIKFMEQYLPVPHFCTFAAGDADNDISMLQAAGTAIAMYNATDNVKAVSDIVTLKSNNEDGLIEILSKWQ